MSTAVSERLPGATQRFVLHDIDWRGYQSLLEVLGDRPIRVTYDRGTLELMSPLYKHERNKSLFALMVQILAEELGIPLIAAGATTLNREDLDRGLEADASFYVGDLSRIKDRLNLDLEVDPPPDLAIEIQITRSVLDRLGIYGALGVTEIWRFDGRTLRILQRQSDGSYHEMPRSQIFPWITTEEITRFAQMDENHDDTQWARSFRAWVREVVLLRLKLADEDESGTVRP